MMKITTIALATAFALSTTTLAFAQAGGANGAGAANLPENSGAAVNGGGAVVGRTTNGVTTGMSNGGTKRDGMANGGMKNDSMPKDGMKKDGTAR